MTGSPRLPGPSLARRNAIVTGGSGGIGSEVVRRMLEAGARVMNLDLAGTDCPTGAEPIVCDLAEPAEILDAVAEAGERCGGRVHAIVHCAGITRDAVLWKMSEEDWDRVLRVNLHSAFHLLKAAAPLLRAAEGGSVVLLSSINGQRGKFGQANYAASKAGLEALARTAAREMGRFGIRVNAVAPGFVSTPMTARLPEEVRARAIEETALGRAAEPADVAHAVLFLLSDLARHVTGQVIRVDGGQLIA